MSKTLGFETMLAKKVSITLQDEALSVVLSWDCFDGDDCFEDFRIRATQRNSDPRVYEFGPCAIRAVRKMKQFLGDVAQQSVGGGFQHPDVRTYDWYRIGSDLKLLVKFEGSKFEAEHTLKSPTIQIAEEPYSYDQKA